MISIWESLKVGRSDAGNIGKKCMHGWDDGECCHMLSIFFGWFMMKLKDLMLSLGRFLKRRLNFDERFTGF